MFLSETCDFVRKYFVKISCRKFPDNLKRANHVGNNLWWDPFLMKLQE